MRVIDDPAFADIFAPDALAEAPVAAVVGETVVAGTVDRLLVTDGHVRVIDFKTGSRVPARLAEVPVYHLRQMAAYVAALETVRSEEHTSELQSLMRISYAVFCLKKKKTLHRVTIIQHNNRK